MERKKAKKVNLQKQRGTFLSIGVLLSLSLVLLAFEWGFSVEKNDIAYCTDFTETDAIPPTFVEQKIEPPKPKALAKMEIIDNTDKIEEDKTIDFSSEIDIDGVIDIDIPFKEDNNDIDLDIPFYAGNLEFPATFKGGNKALFEFIRKNTIYPEELRELRVKGKVWIEFVINKKGEVTNVVVKRSPNKSLSKAAIKTIKSLPDWNPAKQNGKSVSMYFTIPINFILN